MTDTGGVTAYLNAPVRSKTPVGKVQNPNFDTISIMHRVTQDDEGNWWLVCDPKKPARYAYKGFREVITCTKCRSRRHATPGTEGKGQRRDAPPELSGQDGTAEARERIAALPFTRLRTGFFA